MPSRGRTSPQIWLAAGAALAAQTGRDYRLLGLEAEPRHFQWMLRHFKQNNISEDRYIALNAAAVGKPGRLPVFGRQFAGLVRPAR